MANLKLMPDPIDIREVTFTNILLLGFDVEISESQYRIPFTRDMFAVPNRKAMEVIFHFLFTKLNNDSAKESFRNCWPIVDKRKEQEFRKICIEWLNKIKKDDSDSRLPTIVPSLLLSPTGDRFYQFLFYFSTYVLKQRISRIPAKHGKLPVWPTLSSVNRKYLSDIVRSLTINVVNSKAKLVHYLESVARTKEEWVIFSRELSKEHRKLNKQRRECEIKLKELRKTHEDIFGKSTQPAKEVVRRTQNLQKITEFWKTITKLFESEKALQEHLEDVLNSEKKKRVLDGEDIHFKVPDILLRECERQLQAGKKYQNLYEDGNVNLVSLVQLWNLSLHLIKEAYSQYPLPDVEHDEAYVRAEAHNHANSLNKTVTLSNTLAEKTLPDLKMSIEELKESINESTTLTLKSSREKKFNLDFLPSTPPVQFHGPSMISSNQRVESFSSRKENIETPDAVSLLLHQLKKNTTVNMDNQDDTPVRGLPKNRIPPSIQKENKVKKPVSERKYHSVKKVSQPFSERKHLPANKQISRPTVSTTVGGKSRIPKPKVAKSLIDEQSRLTNETPKHLITPKPGDQSKKLKSKAQELLIDQIAQSVLDNSQIEELLTSSDSEENEAINVHALHDPMEAFSTEAFVSRDKVPRTPSFKKTNQRREQVILSESEGDIEQQQNSEIVIEEEEEEEEDVLMWKTPTSNENTIEEIQGNETPVINPTQRQQKGDSRNLGEAFNLKSLQERIRQIKLAGSDVDKDETLNRTEAGSTDQFRFTTPVSNVNLTSQSPAFNPITPLRFSDDDEEENGFSPFSVTPTKLSDVDFTPIKTPWRKDKKNVNFEDVQTKASENAERNSEYSIETRDSIDFQFKRKSQLELFLENNKDLLMTTSNVTPTNGHTHENGNFTSGHVQYQTPTSKEFMQNNLINFITPFKSPDSPTSRTPRNISAQEVDDFIDEVISSTSKTPKEFTSLMNPGRTPKTPGLFGVKEPQFDNNYSLMTPGLENAGPYRLDFSDDDEL